MKRHHTLSPANVPSQECQNQPTAYFAVVDSAMTFLTYRIISAGCMPAPSLSFTTCKTSSGLINCGSYCNENKITPRAGTSASHLSINCRPAPKAPLSRMEHLPLPEPTRHGSRH